MITVEILCPESLREAANHLAAAKGLSMADMLTFGNPNYERDGHQFIWVGVQVTEDWLTGMQQPAERPGYDAEEEIDLDAANAVLAGTTVLLECPDIEDGPLPEGLVILLGSGLVGVYGLGRIVEE